MFMFNPPLTTNSPHKEAAFWLDVFDKIIKFSTLLVGGVWIWINFKRSRIYAQKLTSSGSESIYA